VKGVGKFGEVMAGEKGEVEIDVVLEKLRRVIRSGSQPKAIFDFVLKELRRSFARYTWAGVYMVEGEELVLKAWSGPHATQHVRIPIGEGICGLAARTGETVVVGDVSKDPRYLECFPDTRSEIVVPILRDGIAIGEIDVDSDALEAFSGEDRAFLEELADELAKVL
jgi:GAF domain-containing protein